jgi:hypothetical protein
MVDMSSKKLICEASDLEPSSTKALMAVKSHKTGVISRWERCETFTDSEGEVQGWRYAPTAQTLSQTPNLSGWTMVVYND